MPGLLDRLGGKLFPAQQPMDGLLTPEDIANAQKSGMLSLGAGLLAASGPSTQRTTFGQAAGQAIQGAQAGYQGSIDTAMQRRGASASYQATQLKLQEAMQRKAAKAAILAKYPLPEQGDDESLRKWIVQTLPLWSQADPEMAGNLTNALNATKPSKNPAQTVRSISGEALGLDKSKTYSVQVDDAGNIVGKPLAEGLSPNAAATDARAGTLSPAQSRMLRGQFLTQTSDLRHRASMIGMAYAALDSATGAHPNTAAYASAISKFIQAVDQDKNLREGMLHWFEEGLTPAYADQMKKAWEKRTVGQFPPELVAGMMRHLDEMTGEIRGQYDSIYGDFSQTYPGVAVPKTDVYFPARKPAAAPSGLPKKLPGESVADYLKRTRGN